MSVSFLLRIIIYTHVHEYDSFYRFYETDARTLAEWRRRFNFSEAVVRKLGFDDVFMRVWNYYLTYCEAGFHSQTENCKLFYLSTYSISVLDFLIYSSYFSNSEYNYDRLDPSFLASWV